MVYSQVGDGLVTFPPAAWTGLVSCQLACSTCSMDWACVMPIGMFPLQHRLGLCHANWHVPPAAWTRHVACHIPCHVPPAACPRLVACHIPCHVPPAACPGHVTCHIPCHVPPAAWTMFVACAMPLGMFHLQHGLGLWLVPCHLACFTCSMS